MISMTSQRAVGCRFNERQCQERSETEDDCQSTISWLNGATEFVNERLEIDVDGSASQYGEPNCQR